MPARRDCGPGPAAPGAARCSAMWGPSGWPPCGCPVRPPALACSAAGTRAPGRQGRMLRATGPRRLKLGHRASTRAPCRILQTSGLERPAHSACCLPQPVKWGRGNATPSANGCGSVPTPHPSSFCAIASPSSSFVAPTAPVMPASWHLAPAVALFDNISVAPRISFFRTPASNSPTDLPSAM